MGIEGREYYRESSRYTDRLSGWSWDTIPPVCKWLVIINVVVFVLQILVTRPASREVQSPEYEGQDLVVPKNERADLASLPRISLVQEWLQLETPKVLRGQVWRLLTSAFCHEWRSVWHLLFNMLFLYWFGRTLEAMYGSREFLLFYLAAAVVASLAYMGLDLITGDLLPAIGASGAVMAVTMLYAIHYPRTVIYVMLIIPIEVRWLVALYVIFDLHPVLLALAQHRASTDIAHAAHLGGLAFGFVYWRYGLSLERLVDRLHLPRWDRTFGPRRSLRVFRPPPQPERSLDNPDSQVDEILKKIHEYGEASLTEQERQVLADASRRYQDRRR